MISCGNLLKQLSKSSTAKRAGVVILDVSWDKLGQTDYAEEFRFCHIPGAFQFDFKHGTFPSELFPNDVPNARGFEAYAQGFGINSDTTVVVYEAMPLSDRLFSAGRVWWLFRYFGHDNVYVLDGGFERWKRLCYPITQDITPSPEAGNFTAVERRHLRVHYEEVVKRASNTWDENDQAAIIDSRSAALFDKGSIPTSINIPLNSFGDDKTMALLPREKLVERFKSFGLNPLDQSVITTCGSGMTACGLACIAFEAGLSDWRVYIGSWAEWSKRQQPEQNTEEKV